MMKSSLKFASLYFAISILLLITVYIVYPELYPGETFLIVWFYVANFVFGSLLFGFFSRVIRQKYFKRRLSYIFSNFFLLQLIVNILSLLLSGKMYTISLVILVVQKPYMRAMALVELVNPIISFVIAYLFFRKSNIWSFNETNESVSDVTE